MNKAQEIISLIEDDSYPKIVRDGLNKGISWVWNSSSMQDREEFLKYLVDKRDNLANANLSPYHKYTSFMGRLQKRG